MSKIAVTCDCTCDLSQNLLDQYQIGRVYCHIITDRGRFCDPLEISALNVFDYMEAGGVPVAESPSIEDFIGLFQNRLQTYDEIIHISGGSKISASYEHGLEAVKLMHMEQKIHIVDSMQLSSGIGQVAIKASQLASEGLSSEEIVNQLLEFRRHISSSFILQNTKALLQNGRISEKQYKFFHALNIHMVLEMRDGKFRLREWLYGDYKSAQIRYIRKEMHRYEQMDHGIAFITHAGCTIQELEDAQAEIAKIGSFEHLYVTEASATVSANCGPHTIGLLYYLEDNKKNKTNQIK